MKTYISLLRGINVSGKNLIKMDQLKKLYEGIGIQNVKTYVQSGNVVFNADKAIAELDNLISSEIKKHWSYDVSVLVLSIDNLKQIIHNNPFTKTKDTQFLHVSFFKDEPIINNLEKIESKKSESEEVHISNQAVYLFCPNGYGKTKLTNTFLETALKTKATTRNWKTTNELLKLAEQIV